VETTVGETFFFLKPRFCKSSSTLKPSGRVWLGLLSNRVLNFELKTALHAGLFVFALSLRQ